MYNAHTALLKWDMWTGLCVSICNRPTSDAHKKKKKWVSGLAKVRTRPWWSWRYQGKCHLTAHIKALDKQPARPPQTLHHCFLGMYFVFVCFVLFSFEITWVTSTWGNRTTWNERDPWGKIFLEGWVYLESPQNLACHSVISPSLYFWASKTPSLASVVLIGSQGTQQGGPGMGGEDRSF